MPRWHDQRAGAAINQQILERRVSARLQRTHLGDAREIGWPMRRSRHYACFDAHALYMSEQAAARGFTSGISGHDVKNCLNNIII